MDCKVNRFKKELIQERIHVLDWWRTTMLDNTNGGFYGRIDGHNQLLPKANKGIILNTRLLWTFAAAANAVDGKQKEEYTAIAQRAYQYLIQYFWDKKQGGVFWMLDYQGKLVQTKKQVYAQAFMIYALSEYYILTQYQPAKEHALELYDLLERHSFDPVHNGYLEAFDRNWKMLKDLRLSEKDANEAKTMNTHLHVLEAYTHLFRIAPSPRLKKQLRNLITLFLEKFVDANTFHLHLFFDEEWHLKSDEISFGHDIEASWLLCEAAHVLVDPVLTEQVYQVALSIANTTLKKGVAEDGRIYNSMHPSKKLDKDCHWWQPAEAMVGFWNVYELTKADIFKQAVMQHWKFIKANIKDMENGEWHWSVTADGQIDQKEDKAGQWKAPYHNVRMLLELEKRIR